ncbi:MAG TPA: hypothetical protein PLF96_09530 [Thermotogota bacterium]|nr:hypothetical protein [Thermotogota bacterium]
MNGSLEMCRESSTCRQKFTVPGISLCSARYQVSGEMIDFRYLLRQRENPGEELFGTCCACGTLGESNLGCGENVRALAAENAWKRLLRKWFSQLLIPGGDGELVVSRDFPAERPSQMPHSF